MSSGVVEEILVSSTPRTPPTSVVHARVDAGRGLQGDRYHAGLGTWSHDPDQTGSDLTLIETEVLEAFGLTGPQARRNLVTRGIRLNSLVGQSFRIGEIECRGIRLCGPCSGLARHTGDRLGPLVHRSGLRADILSDGKITVGDPIAPAITTSHDFGAISDAEFRHKLAQCRLRSGGLRLGLVPFDAHCVVDRLATPNGINPAAVAAGLERWAQSLGGEVVDTELLWLPANQFEIL